MRATTIAFLAIVAAGCSDRSEPRLLPHTRLLYRHGIEEGSRLRPRILPCADGRDRTIAPSKASQLVTFWTNGDCATCERHLTGLDAALRKAPPASPHVIVAYAPSATQLAVRQTLAAHTSALVCFDSQGAYWDDHNLQHTPVTALVDNGRILYLNDRPITSTIEQDQLLLTVWKYRGGDR